MENKIDFIELAEYCRKEYETEHSKPQASKYVKTFYAALSEDEKLTVSSTPHILKNANKCILIHESSCRAVSLWYPHFKFQIIDQDGAVHENLQDEDMSIVMRPGSFDCAPVMVLYRNDKMIASFLPPFEKSIYDFWKLFLKCRECKNAEEAVLLGKLYMSDRRIVELEKENDNLKYANELLRRQDARNEILLRKIEELLKTE